MSQCEPEYHAAPVAGVYFCAAPACAPGDGIGQELARRDGPGILLMQPRQGQRRQSLHWSPEVIRLTCPRCGAWNCLEQP